MAGLPQAANHPLQTDWRTARKLYAIYSAVMAHYDLGVPPCPEIESLVDREDSDVLERVNDWITLMDEHCPVMFLRQVLQRDRIGTQENILALIRRHLERPDKTVVDRTKLDFLLVQYFVNSLPDGLSPGEVTLEEVGKALQPVLGPYSLAVPEWLEPLNLLCDDVLKCRCMQDLVDHHILQRGREIKASAGDQFFDSVALLVFTRYNILLRRAFIYSLHADLEVLRRNVSRLESLGVKSIDARSAGLSDHEALASVRRICLEWRNLLSAEYSEHQVFRAINELRACTDAALRTAQERRQQLANFAGWSWSRIAGVPMEAEPARERVQIEAPEEGFDAPLQNAIEPEMTVERAFPELTVDYETIAANSARHKIPVVIGRIRAQLAQTQANARARAVYFGSSKIKLSSWEMKAFLADDDETVGAVKDSVAARLILRKAFDEFREGITGALSSALTIAHCEAARTQELIAQIRERCDIDRIVFLSATAQRLLELIREAEYAIG